MFCFLDTTVSIHMYNIDVNQLCFVLHSELLFLNQPINLSYTAAANIDHFTALVHM